MPFFNIVAETNENTVVTDYTPLPRTADAYQSEAELEKEFIEKLCEQGYAYLTIHTEKELIANLRTKLEELNHYTFSDSEWDKFFKNCIANQNEGIVEKTELVHIEKKWYNRSMRYTSDLTDTQWEQIKEYFPAGNRSKYDKRELVNAVLYLVKTGCQWRNLPKDFPNWKAVSMFYYRAQKKGVWDKILKMLVKKTRKAQGKNEEPTYALIDSQSVKTTAASEKRGYDGGKKRKDANDIS